MFRAEILENGDITNIQILQRSGIRKLDELLLRNLREWKYLPRPGCGSIESNIAVTVDWVAATSEPLCGESIFPQMNLNN